MDEQDTKGRLLSAAINLLLAAEFPNKVTARQIAKEADANLAMINYFFKSKDELVNQAIAAVIEEKVKPLASVIDNQLEPRERLYRVLNYYCDISVAFQKFLELSVPYKLLAKPLEVPMEILEIIEEFYQHRIPVQYSRMIALQITSFTELLFLRAADFRAYSGINMGDKRHREQYLRFQVELFLQDKSED